MIAWIPVVPKMFRRLGHLGRLLLSIWSSRSLQRWTGGRPAVVSDVPWSDMIYITFASIAALQHDACNSGWSLVDVVCQPIQIAELCWTRDSITSRTKWNRPFFPQVSPIRDSDMLKYIFSASAASKPNFSPIAFQIFIIIILFL